MTLLILAQIGARFIGEIIPSSEDFAGWLLSVTIFFGLAYTFNNGGHIRVTIILGRLSRRFRYGFEIINLVIGLLITGYLAYYTVYTVYESYNFKDVTDTYVALPLWWVQLPMAVGSLVCLSRWLIVLSPFAGVGYQPMYPLKMSWNKGGQNKWISLLLPRCWLLPWC